MSPLTRSDHFVAWILGALSLALYAATACPSLFVGDTAEIAGAAATFGVPHPPGYPLFTMLTGALMRLAPSTDVAHSANLVVGLYGAIAVALLSLLSRRLGFSTGAASFAALSLATGRVFWSQCTASEVYSFDVLLLFASMHALLTLARTPLRSPKAVRIGVLTGIVLGIWIGHRTLNVAFAPSLLWFFVTQLPPGEWRKRVRAIGWLVLGAVLGLGLPLSYLILASRAQPYFDIGDPESLPRLWEVLRGAPYTRHLAGASNEQILHRAELFAAGSLNTSQLGLAFYAALAAVWSAVRRSTSHAGAILALTSLAVIDGFFACRYSVLDVEVFFLPAWAACALLAGFGWDCLVTLVRQQPANIFVRSLAIALGLVALPTNYANNDLSDHKLTRAFATTLFESLPKDAIFFVNGDTSIHCAWFLQGVLKEREDLTIVSLGHIVPWHLEQLSARHPIVHWPEYSEAVPPSEYARALMLANIESRPICISSAIDASSLLRRDESRAYEAFTRGLVRQVYYTGQSFDLRERVNWNLELFEEFRSRAGDLPESPDMDSRSTLLQCSLGLYFTAQRARQGGWNELELQALEASLAFDPDRHEQAIYDDVLAGLGVATPLNRFGKKARERITELRALLKRDSEG